MRYSLSQTRLQSPRINGSFSALRHLELIEIYSLAHVNRKKLNIPKQQKLFSTFCLNVSSKTIS